MDNLKKFQTSIGTEFNVRKCLVLTAILISILRLTVQFYDNETNT